MYIRPAKNNPKRSPIPIEVQMEVDDCAELEDMSASVFDFAPRFTKFFFTEYNPPLRIKFTESATQLTNSGLLL